MGFNMLFYIIFGTNLLTESPVPVSVFFAYFRVSIMEGFYTNTIASSMKRE